jgi:hypothetical protein
MAVSVFLLTLVTVSAFAYASSSGFFGFEVYETCTHALSINLGNIVVGSLKTFKTTVECEKKTGVFLVTYFLSISGPRSLCNDYLRVGWLDTDGAAFTIGKGGSQMFSGTGTLGWNSAQTVFEAGHKNNIALTLTFLTTAAVGAYRMNMWVAFTPALSVAISPSSATLYLGQCQLFASSVTGGTSRYSYQWYLNGAPVSRANKPTWTFTPTSAGSYTVYVKVTDSAGKQTTSNTATVTVNRRLSVCISPSSVDVNVGQSQLFTSSVTGGISPYKYRWYLNGVPVSGSTNPTWTFTPTSPGSFTVYVKVTDNAGTQAISNTACARAKGK